MWEPIKQFFSNLSNGLGEAGQYLITGVVVIVLVVGSILIAQQWTNSNQQPDSSSEIAQGPRGSIGEALPPDVNIEIVDNPDKDKTIAQGQPTDTDQTVTVDNSKSEGQVKTAQTETFFISPPTGLDPNKPVNYYNPELGFKLTLPAGSTVQEHNHTVNMFSESGQLLATITVIDSSESLDEVRAQLSLSSEVSALIDAKLGNQTALQYNVRQQTGYALKANSKLYYLTGQNNILSQFSI